MQQANFLFFDVFLHNFSKERKKAKMYTAVTNLLAIGQKAAGQRFFQAFWCLFCVLCPWRGLVARPVTLMRRIDPQCRYGLHCHVPCFAVAWDGCWFAGWLDLSRGCPNSTESASHEPWRLDKNSAENRRKMPCPTAPSHS